MKRFLFQSKKKLKELTVYVNLLWLKIIAREITVRFQNILVLSPHYDDEVLGVGGIIMQTLQKGGKVYIVFLSDGQNTGSFPDKEKIAKERCLLAERVMKEFNIPEERIYWRHLPDEDVPRKGHEGFSAVREKISEIIELIKPDA